MSEIIENITQLSKSRVSKLEIQLAEKRIKEFIAKKELKLEAIEQLNGRVNERKIHLKAKRVRRNFKRN